MSKPLSKAISKIRKALAKMEKEVKAGKISEAVDTMEDELEEAVEDFSEAIYDVEDELEEQADTEAA